MVQNINCAVWILAFKSEVSSVLDNNKGNNLDLSLLKGLRISPEVKLLNFLYIILSLLEVNEGKLALDVIWSDFILQIFIDLSRLLNLLLLFFEKGILKHEINSFKSVCILDTVLEFGSGKLRIFGVLLKELYVRYPEVAVLV